MRIDNVLVCKDILKGEENLVTLKDVYFSLKVPRIPFDVQIAIFISLHASTEEIGKPYPMDIRMFTPDKNRFVILYNDSMQIRDEVSLLYLKGKLSMVQEGKQVISIRGNIPTPLYEEPLLNIVRVANIDISSPGTVLGTSTSYQT